MHAADHARRFSAECPASFQAGHRRTQRLNPKAVHGASVRGPPSSSTSRTATHRNRRPALDRREPPPGSPRANDRSGLPAAAGPVGKPQAVTISTFREDGWMSGGEAAALVRVSDGSAQILVTVYQAPSAPLESATQQQMMLLGADGEAVGGPTQRV